MSDGYAAGSRDVVPVLCDQGDTVAGGGQDCSRITPAVHTDRRICAHPAKAARAPTVWAFGLAYLRQWAYLEGVNETSTTFEALGLHARIVANLEHMGIVDPRPIQVAAIPALLDGRDVIGLARTGTGKTVAYAAPIVQRLLDTDRTVRGIAPAGLVICPTRELAEQVAIETTRVMRRTGLRTLGVYGKVGIQSQIDALRAGIDVLVGTPGRLRELVERGEAVLEHATFVVIDEADRMMDMGFRPQVERLLAHTPAERQGVFISATMPGPVAALAHEILREPQRIEVDRHTTAVEHVGQRLISIHNRDKVALLIKLLEDYPTGVLVFCRTRRRVGWVGEALGRHGVNVDMIHADRSQAQRRKILERFGRGELDVVVASDVAARGLHLPLVQTVVQYDVPDEPEEYVHRMGRAAHGGDAESHGVSITFLARPDADQWDAIVDRVDVFVVAEEIEGFASDPLYMEEGSGGPPARKRIRKAKSNPSRGRSGKSRPIKPGEKPGGGVRRLEDRGQDEGAAGETTSQ